MRGHRCGRAVDEAEGILEGTGKRLTMPCEEGFDLGVLLAQSVPRQLPQGIESRPGFGIRELAKRLADDGEAFLALADRLLGRLVESSRRAGVSMVFPIEIEQVGPGSRESGLNANGEPVVEALLLDEEVELVDAGRRG